MSRRRQSYRTYVSPTRAELHDICYGTQARRTDRAQLRLIHAEQAQPDDLTLTPYCWLALLVALALGAALMPLAYVAVLALAWIAEVLP